MRLWAGYTTVALLGDGAVLEHAREVGSSPHPGRRPSLANVYRCRCRGVRAQAPLR